MDTSCHHSMKCVCEGEPLTKMTLHSNMVADNMNSAECGTQTAMDKLHLTKKCYKTVSNFDFVLFH